jgi:hypothetical protein
MNESERRVRLQNALLRGTLAKCVKAMSTLEVGVPLQVAMADQKFRAFLDAAKEGSSLLHNMGPVPDER